jgi:phosphoribosylglycinamide formyltransferase-1
MPKNKYRIAVLASTRGTDLQAIIDEMEGGKMPGVELAVVLSDQYGSYALERARAQQFEAQFVDPENKNRKEYGEELIRVLDQYQVDLICLVGFMRILSAEFVQHFKHKIINVHPALLPKYGGKGFYGANVHEAVLKNGDKETGMTIHFVDEGTDTGPIIHQESIVVEPGDEPNDLKRKVQLLEKKWYPEVIRWLQHGKVVVAED